jgi:hypothetical protein
LEHVSLDTPSYSRNLEDWILESKRFLSYALGKCY